MEREATDFVARPYQDQLLDLATKRNVIIYLPTGAGKTFISLMVMKRLSKNFDKTIEEGGQRSIFIANTVTLAYQQTNVIRNFLPFKTNVYTGELNVDNWKKDKWNNEFNSCQVIVATCQVIVDVIQHGYLSLSSINLLIFDECHHATSNHPMRQLMSFFKHVPDKDLPRIIGLTGILVKTATVNNLLSTLQSYEAVFRCTIATVANMEEFQNVLVYSTKPKESLIVYAVVNSKPPVVNKVNDLVRECLNLIKCYNLDGTHMKLSKNLYAFQQPSPIKKISKEWNEFLYQLEDLGVYGGSIAILSILVEFELQKRASDSRIHRDLVRVCITYCEQIHHLLVDYINDDDDPDTEEEKILSYSSPKIQKFVHALIQIFRGKSSKEIKCLVFVQRRQSAKCIYHLLQRLVESKPSLPIKPDFMVGRNGTIPDSIENILSQKRERNVLRKFRNDETNLIVASSVLEEGIDIQSCNYVIYLDKVTGFRSYIQSKGRARMETSYYYMFISQADHIGYCSKISQYRAMDKILKNYLIGRAVDRIQPESDEVAEQFKDYPEPFKTPTGASLDMISAVKLINRYCQTLPNDSFTKAAIDWKKEDSKMGIVVSITLPIQSTIKHKIFSEPMKSSKLAKQSAAFNACKELYYSGELNNNLLPLSKTKCIEMIDPIYFKHWASFMTESDMVAGTSKLKRCYNIQYPNEFISAMPVVGESCFLYEIDVKPTFQSSPEYYHIIDLFNIPTAYAICTTKVMPKIAPIHLYMTAGCVVAEICSTPQITVVENADDLECLRNFHYMIFKDVLKIFKQNFLARDYENKNNSFLIVPITSSKKIDWDLVKKFQSLSTIQTTSEMQRSRMCFDNSEDYLNRIVCTWYTHDASTRYVVSRVREDLNPSSPFPTNDFESFASYVFEKYNTKIVNNNPFLLECKALSSKLNYKYAGEGEFGKKRKSKRFDDILLIPELCHNFKFPANMWMKAFFLPTILHRLHFLLLADDIRVKINLWLGINDSYYTPKPVTIDSSLKRNQKLKSSATIPPLRIEENFFKPSKSQLQALNESMEHPWKEHEEPIDIDRSFNKIFKIEVDYYHYFLRDKFKEDNNTGVESINITSLETNLPAICDVSDNEKRKIDILNIGLKHDLNSAEQREFLCAITAASTNDVFDMERYEILGDSFLKFSISFFLINEHPNWNEGLLTVTKSKFVSNRNLLYCAIQLNIPSLINVSEFKPLDDWRPPLVSVPLNAIKLLEEHNSSTQTLWCLNLDEEEIKSGNCKSTNINKMLKELQPQLPNEDSVLQTFIDKQTIDDKTCADCMEAILGVCVKNYGIHRAFSVLNMLGICPSSKDFSTILGFKAKSPRVGANIPDSEIDSLLINYQKLEQNLGYTFNDRAYLLQALTHPSYVGNRLTECYQQLEFIGDAVLDFLISCYIFERVKNVTPGLLTDLRSALVNNVTLGCISIRNKFHLFMLSQNAGLSKAIAEFIEFTKLNNYTVTDEVRILLSEKDCETDQMAEYIEIPKVLGDIFESLIAAVFLDSGNDLNRTWAVIYRLMSQEINEFMVDIPLNIIRQLYEKNVQAKFHEPYFEEDLVLVLCSFVDFNNQKYEVTGIGKNSKQAKIAAAKLALQCLNK